MKTRVEQMYCSVKYRQVLVVQKWKPEGELFIQGSWPPGSGGGGGGGGTAARAPARWEAVRDFKLSEYEKAREFARQLSLPSPERHVRVEFEDGSQVA